MKGKNLKDIPEIFTKPQTQSIKLSKTAQAQHNTIKELADQNDVLLMQLKKCKETIERQKNENLHKNESVSENKKKLQTLIENNQKLEMIESGLSKKVEEETSVLEQRRMKSSELSIANSRMEKEIKCLLESVEDSKVSQRSLKEKIGKKEDVYEESQRSIQSLQEDNKKVQSKIDEVQKEIIKLESVLKSYKNSEQ